MILSFYIDQESSRLHHLDIHLKDGIPRYTQVQELGQHLIFTDLQHCKLSGESGGFRLQSLYFPLQFRNVAHLPLLRARS